jgi:hypothetical protein
MAKKVYEPTANVGAWGKHSSIKSKRQKCL